MTIWQHLVAAMAYRRRVPCDRQDQRRRGKFQYLVRYHWRNHDRDAGVQLRGGRGRCDLSIWQQLVRCAERGGSSEGELLAKLGKGHSRLWPIEGGCLVIDRTSDGAALAWLGVGKGRLKALAAQESAIADMARADGCRVLRIHGRRGWIKVFPHWEVTGHDGELVVMELEL